MFKKKKSWWLLKDSHFMVLASRIKVSMAGMRAFQKIGDFVKPTTRMIQVFGRRATSAIFDMNEAELKVLAAGKPLPINMELENGYVILSLQGQILGLGLLIDGILRSQIPKKELHFFTP